MASILSQTAGGISSQRKSFREDEESVPLESIINLGRRWSRSEVCSGVHQPLNFGWARFSSADAVLRTLGCWLGLICLLGKTLHLKGFNITVRRVRHVTLVREDGLQVGLGRAATG